MITIMNKLRQPLIVNVSEGKSIHFLARETKEIEYDDFNSLEVKRHIELGNLLVLKME